MKDFLAFAQERRSYRTYNTKSVSLELVADCLLAASFAPSAGDVQPWEFLVVEDAEQRAGVVRACEDQDWLHDAPTLVVVLGDTQRAEAYHGELGVKWCRDSCCAATQNLLLAAHERGLAGCWVSAFDDVLIQEALRLPDHVMAVSVVALGYSDELLIEKSVTPLDSLVHFDVYGRRRRDESEDMGDYGEVFLARKQALSKRVEQIASSSTPAKKSFSERVQEIFGRTKK